jgi:hypothetical protein
MGTETRRRSGILSESALISVGDGWNCLRSSALHRGLMIFVRVRKAEAAPVMTVAAFW